MATLCLNMIVKNEAHIIEATLRMLCAKLPIDYWVISDTGSTDQTVEIIQSTFLDLHISGELYHDQWQNFGDNRQLALDHARGKAEYILFFDADDMIEGEIHIPFGQAADAYHADFVSEDGTTAYQRILVVRDSKAKWRGVLHEFIELKPDSQIANLSGTYRVISRRLGSRSQQSDKYRHDAEVLVKAIEEGRDPDLYARYLFYCAQSYRDAAMPQQAAEWYKKRATEVSGWAQERYESYLNLGFLAEGEGDTASALYNWALATTIDPERMEAWYHQARLHRWQGRVQLAYLFAQAGADLTLQPDRLFIANDIYDYWMAYENFLLGCEMKEWERAYRYLKQLIQSDAPHHLYLDQANQIQQLAHCAQADTYENSKDLVRTLKAKGCEQVAEWLQIS